jgi:hypothetical protein
MYGMASEHANFNGARFYRQFPDMEAELDWQPREHWKCGHIVRTKPMQLRVIV